MKFSTTHRLWWYIFKNFFSSTLTIGVALTAAIWLTQSLRYVDFVMSKGLSIKTFLVLISYLLPELVAAIVPVAVFAGALFAFSKMSQDHEIEVLRSLGLSNFQLTTPILALVGGLLLILILNNTVLHPLSAQRSKDMKAVIRDSITAHMLQPGEFKSYKGYTFYVRSKNQAGEMRGVFIYDKTHPETPVTIMAEKGLVMERPEGVHLVLINGSRQSLEKETLKPDILSFDQYSVEVKNQVEVVERQRKPSEYFFWELWQDNEGQSDQMKAKLRLEIFQRFLLPVLMIPFVLIAACVFLVGDMSRRGRSKRMILGVLTGVSLQGVMMLSMSAPAASLWAKSPYVILCVSSGAALYCLFKGRFFQWMKRVS